MPAGRPTDYDSAFCQRVIEFGKEGMGRAEIASALDCSRQTLANWEVARLEFMDALKRAQDESLAWWERKARSGVDNRDFNSSLWGKCMSGRFPAEPYRDRVQLSGDAEAPIVVEAGVRTLKDRARGAAFLLAKKRKSDG